MHLALFVFAALTIALRGPSLMAAESLPMPPPGGVEASPDGRIVISSRICAALGPDATVPGADYQSGRDVHGNKVAPADLPSNTPPLPLDNFPIEIRKDLAGSFNVPASGGSYGAKAILGYVTVRGRTAYFNGRPLNSDQRQAMIEACRRARPAGASHAR
jgi:hypothetical protein